MKACRHHNNTGLHGIRSGKTVEEMRRLARLLGISFKDIENLILPGSLTM